jgi:Big-like domain-containing protein
VELTPRIETRFVCVPERARRGERVIATLHNDGPNDLFFGAMYEIERRCGDAWIDVDPFDGDENVAWPAIGYLLQPGGTFGVGFDVPRVTEPGLHRVIKHVASEEAGVLDAALTAEFTVEA